jgi:hypothetical protein
MRYRGLGIRTVLLLAAALVAPQWAFGQAGVVVDANGVLSKHGISDVGGRLDRQRATAAKAALNAKVAMPSKLRKISLQRLERAIADHQNVLSDEMRYLAGLQRVRYVFYYPDTQDIVLAGPAEGWYADEAGHVLGINSGRPVVELQDLITALRAFPPGDKPTKFIGCSIDPTKEGLAALQAFVRSVGSQITPGSTQYIVQGVQSSLGMHNISVYGVSPKTHFAQVLVEADYRMKLIGIGLERPPVRMVSYVDRANPAQVSRNALQRWYFTPDYQCVRIGEDGMAMELVGDGVKLIGEDELVSGQGQRRSSGRTDRASQLFVTGFTRQYAELADRSPVYAQLRNLVDLAVAAAHIQKQDLYSKAGWKMEVFADEQTMPVETYNAPKQVASTVNAIIKGTRLMTPVAGGVNIQAMLALTPEKVLDDDQGRVAKLRHDTKIELAKGQWWWD